MYKKALLVIIVLLIAALLGIVARYYFYTPASGNPALSTQALFAANFPDSEGQPQALEQWRGNIVVVNFWATWCPPCREEMPELSQLQQQYRDHDVVVLGIATETVAQISDFANNMPVSYPLLAGDMAAMDVARSLGNDKGVLPYTVIVKADGSIAKSYFGRVNKALLEQTLLPLLAPAD